MYHKLSLRYSLYGYYRLENMYEITGTWSSLSFHSFAKVRLRTVFCLMPWVTWKAVEVCEGGGVYIWCLSLAGYVLVWHSDKQVEMGYVHNNHCCRWSYFTPSKLTYKRSGPLMILAANCTCNGGCLAGLSSGPDVSREITISWRDSIEGDKACLIDST